MNNKETVLEERDPRELFREHLEKRGIKQKWLADESGVSQEHISNLLCSRVLLTDENRDKFNKILETDY